MPLIHIFIFYLFWNQTGIRTNLKMFQNPESFLVPMGFGFAVVQNRKERISSKRLSQSTLTQQWNLSNHKTSKNPNIEVSENLWEWREKLFENKEQENLLKWRIRYYQEIWKKSSISDISCNNPSLLDNTEVINESMCWNWSNNVETFKLILAWIMPLIYSVF